VLSEFADFAYKCTDYYVPDDERGIIWNDPDIGIRWPVAEPLLSDKDRGYSTLNAAPHHDLPA
jgi:dTDP-4-dehydrorhamnose 3,5-epimerase